MGNFINAMMATLISFLTCLAPVYAMENFKHTFKCEGEAFGETVELSGAFTDDKQVYYAVSDPINGLTFSGAGQLSLSSSNMYIYSENSKGYDVRINEFFKGASHFKEAQVDLRNTRVSYYMECTTSCSVCSLSKTISDTNYCVDYCGCPEAQRGQAYGLCGMW